MEEIRLKELERKNSDNYIESSTSEEHPGTLKVAGDGSKDTKIVVSRASKRSQGRKGHGAHSKGPTSDPNTVKKNLQNLSLFMTKN